MRQLAATILLLIVFSNGFSQTLDPSFNGTGLVLRPCPNPNHPTSNELPKQMLEQPDGKILLLNEYSPSSYMQCAVTRYNVDGSIDLTFGTGGTVLFGDSGFGSHTFGVDPHLALLSDGKLVYMRFDGGSNFYMLKLNPDGSPDTTLSPSGFKQINTGTQMGMLRRIVFTPDDKILATIYQPIGNNQVNMALIKFNANLTVDTTFSEDGIFEYMGSPGALLLSGNNIFLGLVYSDSAVLGNLHYDTGTINTSFGTNGFKPFNQSLYKVKFLPDGKMVAICWILPNRVLRRFDSDFNLDTTFATNGSSDILPMSAINLDVQDDGKIVVVGTQGLAKTVLQRYTADGFLDNNSGSPVSLFTTIGPYQESTGEFVFVDHEGRYVVAGRYRCRDVEYPSSEYASFLMRLLPDGVLATQHSSQLDGCKIYPNPSAGNTTVSYNLHQKQQISMALIDANGRNIAMLCQNEMQSGLVKKEIIMPDVAKGIYFVQITSASGISENLKWIKQ